FVSTKELPSSSGEYLDETLDGRNTDRLRKSFGEWRKWTLETSRQFKNPKILDHINKTKS
ncbi:unnamed protein product, partial [Callosobruchus maculatus]